MRQTARVLIFALAILVFIAPFSAANSVSVDIIAPESAGPGDIVSFNVVVTNLASVYLDHCNYIFSVNPYVDLIQICGNWIDESLHQSSFFSTMDPPPQYGENSFFSMPVLGKISNNAPAGAIISSSFWIELVADEEDPSGQVCPGCWRDEATGGNFTEVQSAMPAPEFPGMMFPGIMLLGLIYLVFVGKNRIK